LAKAKKKDIVVKKEIPEQKENSEELEKTDALDDFLFQATNYVYKKRKLFITLGVALAIIILSGYGINWYIGYQENIRTEKLYRIEAIVQDNNISNDQKFEKALPMINDFLDEYAGSKQAEIVLFYRSSLNYHQKKYDKAGSDLREVLTVLEKPSDFHVIASVYLSNILRDQGNIDEAVIVLNAAKSEIMTDLVMLELAETYISSNQKDAAKQTLDAIVKDYPNSLYASRAKQLLAGL
jgi:predicted negative regulator of RcsB-dependent stress response